MIPAPLSVTPAKAGVHAGAERPTWEVFADIDASLRWHDEPREK
jgi:hypothetical protein